MQSLESPENQQAVKHELQGKRESFGWGLFLVLTGAAIIAERAGWLPANTHWLLPIILIAWGAAKIYAAFASRE